MQTSQKKYISHKAHVKNHKKTHVHNINTINIAKQIIHPFVHLLSFFLNKQNLKKKIRKLKKKKSINKNEKFIKITVNF